MKKLVLALAMALAVTAYAEERMIDFITWAFDHNATDLSDDSGNTGILQNYDVLWQLIHTPGTSSLPPNLDNENYLADGETLLSSNTSRFLTGSSHDGWDINLLPESDYGVTFELDKTVDAFYVYQRIYELDRGTTAPVPGTYYYDSATVDLVKEPEWNTDMSFVVYAMGDIEQTKGIQPNLQVPGADPSTVPEPATMSLLGLGALAMVLRRKLRK